MENIIIGIDISSKTLDICVKQSTSVEYFSIENTATQIKKFLKTYQKQNPIIAMENTGRFNWYLYQVLPEFCFEVYVLNPLHLTKSQGLVRGKDDKTDAYRIAVFTQKHLEELDPWQPSSLSIQKLKVLMTERNARVKSKRRLRNQCHDYSKMGLLGLKSTLKSMNEQQIQQIDLQIKEIDKLIQQIINEDVELKKQQKLMLSIPGVGKVVSWTMLAKTEAFKKITEPRKMACYSGVVPFKHESGTSVYRKPRVSIFADKQMKSLLHLAAMSAIRLENDLGTYYRRKVKEGKNKMATINAVRNKIIHLIFAIVKSEKKFQNRLVTS